MTGANPAVPEKINLGIGKSIVVDLPRDAKEVFVANPKVANAVVRSTRKVFLIAMSDGATSVFIMDAQGAQIANLEILVGRDMNKLRRTLKVAMPNSAITVTAVDNTVILTGEVGFGPRSPAGDGHRERFRRPSRRGCEGGDWRRDQFAHHAGQGPGDGQGDDRRDHARHHQAARHGHHGHQLARLQVADRFSARFPVTDSTSQPVSNTNINIMGSAGKAKTDANIKALEKDGVARMLAEPTLTAISGEASKFTGGRHFSGADQSDLHAPAAPLARSASTSSRMA